MKSIPPQQFPPREAFLRGKKNPGAEGFSSRRIEGFSDLIPVVLPCNIFFQLRVHGLRGYGHRVPHEA